jgi:hypothetical protein
MQWTKDIDIEEHLKGDLQLICEHCGEDVLLALLDRLKGMQLYLRAKPVREMKRAYVRERSGKLTAKEIAARLEVSQEFAYDMMRSENKKTQKTFLFFKAEPKQMQRLLLILPALLLLGCATTQDIARENRTRTFDSPKDEVVTAAVDAFTEEGYAIASIDRQSGLVTTETQSNSTMAAAFVGDKSRSVQAMVGEKGENQSSLLLTIKLERENAFGQTSSQSLGKDAAMQLYEDWFKKIEAQLE